MGFDAALPMSGFAVSQIVSDEKHYSSFICGVCDRMVSLDSVVSSCCIHPFCRKCIENVVMECYMKQCPCECPSCRADLQDCGTSPSDSMQFGSVRVAVRPLQETQPLAYRVLCRVQVACSNHSSKQCNWGGDYGDFLPHAISHVVYSDSNPGLEKPSIRKTSVKPVTSDVPETPLQQRNASIETRNHVEKETPRTDNRRPSWKSDRSKHSVAEKSDDKNLQMKKPPFDGRTPKKSPKSKETTPVADDEIFDDWHTSINSNLGFCDVDCEDDGVASQIGNEDNDTQSADLVQQEVFQKAEKLLKQANAKFNKGLMVEARKLYTKGIDVMKKIKPIADDEFKLLSNMHSNRAVTYFREKKFDECIEDCEDSIEYEPTLDKSWIRKWRALTAIGEFDEAFCFLRQAAREIPESKKIQEELKRSKPEMDTFLKAQALMDMNEIQSAWLILQQIVETCENVAMLAFCAKVAMAAGESEQALVMVNEALGVNPNHVDCLELHGFCYFLNGDTEEAAHLLFEAFNRHKNSDKLKASLARVQNTHTAYSKARSAIKQGQYKEAIEHFTTAIKASDPLPPMAPLFAMLRTERAECFLLSTQFLFALKDCQEVVSDHREYAPAWIVRSEVLLALGKAEDAQKELLDARRTWGANNPTIEEGCKRVDFELRVVKANADLLSFQKELDGGISERLPISETTGPRRSSSCRNVGGEPPGQLLPSSKSGGSVRQLLPAKKTTPEQNSSFSHCEPRDMSTSVNSDASRERKMNKSPKDSVNPKLLRQKPKGATSGDNIDRFDREDDNPRKRSDDSRRLSSRESGSDGRPREKSRRESSSRTTGVGDPKLRSREKSPSRRSTTVTDDRDMSKRRTREATSSSRRLGVKGSTSFGGKRQPNMDASSR